MSKYYLIHGELHSDELYHYGVVGMKWGIRRYSKKINSAQTKDKADKYANSLSRHREKAEKQINKLDKRLPGLEKAYNRSVTKYDMQASRYRVKADKYLKKAYKITTSTRRAIDLENEARVLNMKATEIENKSKLAKAKFEQNRNMKEQLKKGISEIDEVLANNGKRWLNNRTK